MPMSWEQQTKGTAGGHGQAATRSGRGCFRQTATYEANCSPLAFTIPCPFGSCVMLGAGALSQRLTHALRCGSLCFSPMACQDACHHSFGRWALCRACFSA